MKKGSKSYLLKLFGPNLRFYTKNSPRNSRSPHFMITLWYQKARNAGILSTFSFNAYFLVSIRQSSNCASLTFTIFGNVIRMTNYTFFASGIWNSASWTGLTFTSIWKGSWAVSWPSLLYDSQIINRRKWKIILLFETMKYGNWCAKILLIFFCNVFQFLIQILWNLKPSRRMILFLLWKTKQNVKKIAVKKTITFVSLHVMVRIFFYKYIGPFLFHVQYIC